MDHLLGMALRWLNDPTAVDPKTVFSTSVVLDSGIFYLGPGEFLSSLDMATHRRDVVVLAAFANADRACLTYEFTDPVTLLRHRANWTLQASNDRISEIIETSSIIPSQGDSGSAS